MMLYEGEECHGACETIGMAQENCEVLDRKVREVAKKCWGERNTVM